MWNTKVTLKKNKHIRFKFRETDVPSEGLLGPAYCNLDCACFLKEQ